MKKIVSIFFSLLMCFTCINMSVFAEESNKATLTITTSASNGIIASDGTVDITVSLSENTGIVSCNFLIDLDGLEVTQITPNQIGNLLSKSKMTVDAANVNHRYRAMFDTSDGVTVEKGTGNLVVISCKIPDDATSDFYGWKTISIVSEAEDDKFEFAANGKGDVCEVTMLPVQLFIPDPSYFTSIKVESGTIYKEDTTLTPKNLVVKGVSANGTETEINDYSVSLGSNGKAIITYTGDKTYSTDPLTCEYDVTNKEVTGITLSTTNVNTFKVGSTLAQVLNDITLTAEYNDGTSVSNISVTEDMVSGSYNQNSTASQTLTVTYGGKTTATLTVTLQEKEITSISVKTPPNGKTYLNDPAVNLTGLVLEVTYDVGDPMTVSYPDDGIQVSGFNTATTGQQTGKVSYGGKETNLTIEVYEDKIASISAVANKNTYWYGETISKTDVTVTATYDSGKTTELESDAYEVPTATLTLADTSYTVTVGAKTATVSGITVKDYAVSIKASASKDFQSSYILSGHESAVAAFDSTGLTVTATMESGTDKVLTSNMFTATADVSTVGNKPVTVTYRNEKGEELKDDSSVSVMVSDAIVSSVTVNTDAAKKVYYIGEELDVSGLTLTVVYNNCLNSCDGHDITVTKEMVEGFSSASANDSLSLTVKYGDKTDTFTVEIKEDTITSISVSGPTKTEYYHGDTLDLSGLTVTADYESGKKGIQLADNAYTASPVDGSALNTVGDNTITITAGDKDATVTVNVKDYVKSIKASTGDTFIDTYKLSGHNTTNVAFDPAGLVVTATMASGETKPLALTDVKVSADVSVANDAAPVTVTYTNEKGEVLTDNTSVKVAVSNAAVSSVDINTDKAKKTYYVGDDLNISGITITIKYDNCPSDCSGHSVEVTDAMVTGFNSSTAVETQPLTVTYGGQTVTYDVQIKEDVVTGISLNTTELNAVVGDTKLNTSAVKVTEVWESNKAGADITAACKFDISAVDLNTVGTYKVAVTYIVGELEFTKEITVTVAEADKLTAIEVSPNELIFTVGDTLDISAVVVNEVYASGAKKTLTADDYNVDVSAVKMDTVGEYEIKITHKGNTALTDTIKVTVRAKYLPWNPGTPWYPTYRPETPVVDTKPANGWNGDKYYQNGTAVKGWLELYGNWYYFDRSGSMVTGWIEVDDTWYYMNSNGKMATGWLQRNGNWYYLKSSGAMVTGWYRVDGTWYYFAGSGAMKTGWVMTGGKWYFLKDSGAMATGWLQWKGDWYYLNTPNGDMAVDTKTPDGYYVNADGIWVK